MSYFSPCGYVAPQYYDKEGFGFLKSFTCGFLTTCGLTTIGTPSVDEGESLPLHGNIGNIPAENIYYTYEEDQIIIHATVRDAIIFGNKFVLDRTITCSKNENRFKITDRIKNENSAKAPFMLLYHMNMGYPLLDENSELFIPSEKVQSRDSRAEEGIHEWNKIIPPQPGFAEQCYYHFYNGKKGEAMIFNHKIGKGLSIRFDAEKLNVLTEWKMMGEKDYVLGLEPSNSKLEGRKTIREKGELKYLNPGEEQIFELDIELFDNKAAWEAAK
jgi:hypothetical protein